MVRTSISEGMLTLQLLQSTHSFRMSWEFGLRLIVFGAETQVIRKKQTRLFQEDFPSHGLVSEQSTTPKQAF